MVTGKGSRNGKKIKFEWEAIVEGEWLKVIMKRLGTSLFYMLQKLYEIIKLMCVGPLRMAISNHTFWCGWKPENRQGRNQEMTLLT